MGQTEETGIPERQGPPRFLHPVPALEMGRVRAWESHQPCLLPAFGASPSLFSLVYGGNGEIALAAYKPRKGGAWVAQLVERPPSPPVMIPGSWD